MSHELRNLQNEMTTVSFRDVAQGVAVAAVMFAGLGTVAALWPNPLFMRMTPTGGFEVALLLVQSVLAARKACVDAPLVTE